MIKVKRYIVSVMQTNCYVLEDTETGKILIVDPGDTSKELDSVIGRLNPGAVSYILLTHGHFDHIRAAERYRVLTGAKIVICEDEQAFTKENSLNLSELFIEGGIPPFQADVLLRDHQAISFGNTQINMIQTPGHTKGSVCYRMENLLFTGDTLMKETVGRTDLPTGNFEQLKLSLKKLASLKKDYRIYPGHGDTTTLSYEKNHNLYLGKMDYDDLY